MAFAAGLGWWTLAFATVGGWLGLQGGRGRQDESHAGNEEFFHGRNQLLGPAPGRWAGNLTEPISVLSKHPCGKGIVSAEHEIVKRR